jgi:hypothetical protein
MLQFFGDLLILSTKWMPEHSACHSSSHSVLSRLHLMLNSPFPLLFFQSPQENMWLPVAIRYLEEVIEYFGTLPCSLVCAAPPLKPPACRFRPGHDRQGSWTKTVLLGLHAIHCSESSLAVMCWCNQRDCNVM